MAVPAAVAVKLAEQVAIPVPPATRVQGLPVNEPAGPVLVKLTVPVGVVGLAFVSVTVAVQEEAWLTTTGVEQATVVVVVRNCTVVTVTAKAGLVLPEWVESPLYAPVMLAVPVVEAEKVTEHVLDARVHGLPTNVPVTPA
jgi:hypothetical protein